MEYSLRSRRAGAAAGLLHDAEDDELSGLRRRDADLGDYPPEIHGFGRIGFIVALDVEGLVRRGADQGPGQPLQAQERREVTLDALPQGPVVRLKDDPRRSVENRLAQKNEQSPD